MRSSGDRFDRSRSPSDRPIVEAVIASAPTTWTVDAASGKGTPASAAEWLTLMSAAGVSKGAPSRLYLMQESGLPLSDSIGTDHIATMSGGGTLPTYQQTRAGWTRKFVNFADNASRYLFNGGNITGSVRLLALIAVDSTPAADRSVLYCQGEYSIAGTTGFNKVRFGSAGSGTYTTGSDSPVSGVRPVVIGRDGSVSRFSNDEEKLLPTHGTATDRLYIGAAILNSAAFGVGYMAIWTGSDAEWSAADEKAILQTLGWTIPWSP